MRGAKERLALFDAATKRQREREAKAATYQLAWFDAHMWADAEHFALEEIRSKDFQHGRLYGTVRAVDPFV